VQTKWAVAEAVNSALTASIMPETRPATVIGPSIVVSPSRTLTDLVPVKGRSFPGDPIRSPTGIIIGPPDGSCVI
jgi:hypothetical protein